MESSEAELLNLGTVRKEFNGVAYGGNDATQSWVNDWQEMGEADGQTKGNLSGRRYAMCNRELLPI